MQRDFGSRTKARWIGGAMCAVMGGVLAVNTPLSFAQQEQYPVRR